MNSEQPITTHTKTSEHCTTIMSILHEGEFKGLYVTINAVGRQLNSEVATRVGEEVLLMAERYLRLEKIKEYADLVEKAFHVIVNGVAERIIPDDETSIGDVIFRQKWHFPDNPNRYTQMTAVPATVMNKYNDIKFLIRTANGTMYLVNVMDLKPAKEVPDEQVG